MRLRNGFRLLAENFKNVYKILLYKLIIILVGGALMCALLLPELWDFFKSTEWTAVVADVKGFFSAVIGGDADFLQGFQTHFKESLSALLKLLKSSLPELIGTFIGCAAVYLVERFADTLCYFTVGSVLNDRMDTYAETPFAASYIKNLGKASAYSAVYVPIVFLFDVCTILVCWFLFFYLLSFLNLLASLFLAVTSIVLCQAFKLTMTSSWMPAMTADNMPLGAAMRSYDKNWKKQRKNVFSTYVLTVYLVIIVNAVSTIFTVGSALLITVPASYFLFICEQYVSYYTVKGKKYFLTYDKIIYNRERGDSEHFFEAMEEEEKEGASERNEEEGRWED